MTLADTQPLYKTQSGWNPVPLKEVGNIFLARVTERSVSDQSLVDGTMFLAKGYVVRSNPLRIRWDIIGAAKGITIGPNGMPPWEKGAGVSSPFLDTGTYNAVSIAAIALALIALGFAIFAFGFTLCRTCCVRQSYSEMN